MLILCDARSLPLGSESVDCVVTSPPYWGLRHYGVDGQLGLEETPAEYVANLVEVFREVRRVLKASGTLWLNLGDSYVSAPRGSRGDKSTLDNTGWDRKVARPHGRTAQRGDRASAAHQLSNERDVAGLKPKDMVGIPWRVALALQADGWWLRSDIIWSKPNARPESVRDRPTKAHEYVFLLSKSRRYFYDADAVSVPATSGPNRIKERRFADRYGRPPGPGAHRGVAFPWNGAESRNQRTVWTINTQAYHGNHFATFPEELARRCILAGCPAGGTVLDPFVGSGTTVRVARSLGRYAIGCEINPEYLEQARARVRVTQGLSMEGA